MTERPSTAGFASLLIAVICAALCGAAGFALGDYVLPLDDGAFPELNFAALAAGLLFALVGALVGLSLFDRWFVRKTWS